MSILVLTDDAAQSNLSSGVSRNAEQTQATSDGGSICKACLSSCSCRVVNSRWKKRAFDLDPANGLPNASVRTFAVRLARNVALTVSDEPQENAHPSFVVGSLLLFCGVQQRRLRSGAGGTGGTFFSGFARTQTHRLTLWTVADEDRVYRSRLMTTALAMQNVAY